MYLVHAIIYWKNINFIYNRLFCCNHTWYCINTVSVASKFDSDIPKSIFTYWPQQVEMICLIWLFSSHQQSFNCKGTGLPRLKQYEARINVLAQWHNAVTPVRLEPAEPRSRVKHSTKPLRSQPAETMLSNPASIYKGCYTCQWLDKVDMHVYAKLYQNIPCGLRAMSIFTNC